jgi:hypothetical protein
LGPAPEESSGNIVIPYLNNTSEAVKTRFGRNSEYFFQTKCTLAQKYQWQCSYLLGMPRNTS